MFDFSAIVWWWFSRLHRSSSSTPRDEQGTTTDSTAIRYTVGKLWKASGTSLQFLRGSVGSADVYADEVTGLMVELPFANCNMEYKVYLPVEPLPFVRASE